MKVKKLTQEDLTRILGKGLVILGPKQQSSSQPQPPDYDPEEDDLELLRKTELMRRFRARLTKRGPQVQSGPLSKFQTITPKNSGPQPDGDDNA